MMYVVSGGGKKSRVSVNSVKNLQRKKRSILNLPYLKPFFLMVLRGRCKQQGRTAACVKKAAKICHSPKLEDILTEDFILKMKEINKYKVPTYGGYNPDYKEEAQPLHFPTLVEHYSFIFCRDDK
jgi:hypothetical protein